MDRWARGRRRSTAPMRSSICPAKASPIGDGTSSANTTCTRAGCCPRGVSPRRLRTRRGHRLYLVSGSAVGYYGAHGDEIVTEATPPGRDFLATLCVDWEREAEQASAVTRVAMIRSGLVLDNHGGVLGQMLTPFRLGVGGPLGNGRQFMPWIHIADWVGLLRWLIDNDGARGAFNGTGPDPGHQRRILSRPRQGPSSSGPGSDAGVCVESSRRRVRRFGADRTTRRARESRGDGLQLLVQDTRSRSQRSVELKLRFARSQVRAAAARCRFARCRGLQESRPFGVKTAARPNGRASCSAAKPREPANLRTCEPTECLARPP